MGKAPVVAMGALLAAAEDEEAPEPVASATVAVGAPLAAAEDEAAPEPVAPATVAEKETPVVTVGAPALLRASSMVIF